VIKIKKVAEDDDHIGILTPIGEEAQGKGRPVGARTGHMDI
jgi:hypothetical protein